MKLQPIRDRDLFPYPTPATIKTGESVPLTSHHSYISYSSDGMINTITGMTRRLLLATVFLLLREITVAGQISARSQMEAELRTDRQFRETGTDRLGGKSTTEQHTIFTATRPEALRMGREYRERLLNFMLRQQSPALATQRQALVDTGRCPSDIQCNATAIFRTADGSCNNLRNPSWGQSFIPMRRFIAPEYDNGLFTPRVNGKDGTRLKSAREISTVLHTADPGPRTRNNFISHMTMQFAQFLDHDITLTPIERGVDGSAITCCEEDVTPAARRAGLNVLSRPQCFPISIPPGDRRFKRTCMNFVRSVLVDNADCNLVPAEQLNQLTAYIDGSQVYGSTEEEQHELRAFKGGLLETSKKDPELLPRNPRPECVTSTSPNFCFRAGDERVDEHMALTSMHTIWLREHNRIANTLAKINRNWNDERLFQETRRIVGAMMQHITYTEFLPLVLSPTYRRRYDLGASRSNRYSRDYNASVDASIRNSFATAAYRFGHSMIRTIFNQVNSKFRNTGKIQLRDSFGNTSIILSSNGGAVNTLTRGLLTDPARVVDRHITPEVTDFLFVDQNGNSLDLMALNIQRGRDHGIPGYNAWRKWCGLPTASNFGTRYGGLVDHSRDAANALRKLYSSPDDIDLFSAGVSERPVRGGLIGNTFSCIIARQFEVLKTGDRFWYESGDNVVRFSPSQLREIRRANLARVVCDNTDTTSIQPNPFRIARSQNRVTKCSSRKIRRLNLNRWREIGY